MFDANFRDRRIKGWFWCSNAIFEMDGLTEHDIIVYLYLNRCADGNSQSFPSRSKIAKACKISVKTVDRTLKSLEKAKLLKKTVRQKPNGDFHSNLYEIFDPPEPTAQKKPTTDRYQDFCQGGGVTQSPGGGVTQSPGVATHSRQVATHSRHKEYPHKEYKLLKDIDIQQQQNTLYIESGQEEISSTIQKKDNVVVVDPLPGEQSDRLKEIRDFCRQESLDLFILLTEDAGYMAELLRMAGGDTGVIKDALLASWQYYQTNDVPNLKGLVRQAVADRRRPSPAVKQRKGRQKDKFKMLYV